MPGFELIDQKEQLAVQRLFKKEGGILFAHGFDKLRKSYLSASKKLKKNFFN